MSFYEADHQPDPVRRSEALSPRAALVVGVLVLSVTVLSVLLTFAVVFAAPTVRFTAG